MSRGDARPRRDRPRLQAERQRPAVCIPAEPPKPLCLKDTRVFSFRASELRFLALPQISSGPFPNGSSGRVVFWDGVRFGFNPVGRFDGAGGVAGFALWLVVSISLGVFHDPCAPRGPVHDGIELGSTQV